MTFDGGSEPGPAGHPVPASEPPVPAPSVSAPEPEGAVPASSESAPAPEVAKPASSESAPAPEVAKPAEGTPERGFAGSAEPPVPAPADHSSDEADLMAAGAELDAVEAALARLEDGSFENCEICGTPIGSDRLSEQPLLTRCVAHS